MQGTWKTTGSGGSGLGVAVAVIAAAVIAVPVVGALARVAEVFVITLGAVIGLAVIAAAAVALSRVRQGRPISPLRVTPPRPVPWQRTEPLPAPRRPAIDRPGELHIHFHGVDAEDIAEALRQAHGEPL